MSNVKNIYSSWPEPIKNPLTKAGKAMITEVAKTLRHNYAKHGQGVDMIFASDLLRTKQTAAIVAKALRLPVKFDKRLREASFGSYNSRPASNLFYSDLANQKEKDRESYTSIAKRMKAFLSDIDKKYQGKNILIVSHQCPLWILENIARGLSLREAMKRAKKEPRIAKGELRILNS